MRPGALAFTLNSRAECLQPVVAADLQAFFNYVAPSKTMRLFERSSIRPTYVRSRAGRRSHKIWGGRLESACPKLLYL